METGHPLPNHLRLQPSLMDEGEPKLLQKTVQNGHKSDLHPTSSRPRSTNSTRPLDVAERRKEGYEWLFGE